MSTKKIILHQCIVCKKNHPTFSKAEECQKRGIIMPMYRIGDEVKVKIKIADTQIFKMGVVKEILHTANLNPASVHLAHQHRIEYRVQLEDGPNSPVEEIFIMGKKLKDGSFKLPNHPRRAYSWKEWNMRVKKHIAKKQ